MSHLTDLSISCDEIILFPLCQYVPYGDVGWDDDVYMYTKYI